MTTTDAVETDRIFTATETAIPRASAGLPAAEEGQSPTVLQYTGGALGSRYVLLQDDGSFVNMAARLAPQELTQEEVVLRACMPVAFFQELMHRDRRGKRDELVYEQPGRPDGHPGVRLDVSDLHLKHNGLPLTHHAKTQLCGHARVPVEYFHRLVTQGVMQLAALNVNTGIKLRAGNIRGAQNGKFWIRIKNDVVDGILTDSYGIWDNHDMMDAFVECFRADMVPDLMVSQFWTDGRDIEGTVLIPSGWTNEPGNIFGIGIAFKNSENGRRSLVFRPFVTRNGRGGILYEKKETTNGVLEIKHTSGISVQSVKEEIARNIPVLLRSANSLRTHFMNSQQITVPNPRDVLAALAIRYGIPASTSRLWYRQWLLDSNNHGRANEVTEDEARRYEPLVPTVFGLLDSLMETSLSQPPDAQVNIQVMAGQMLIDGLDKSEADLVQHWMSTVIPAGQRLRRSSTGPARIEEYTVGAVPAPTPTTSTPRGTRRARQ